VINHKNYINSKTCFFSFQLVIWKQLRCILHSAECLFSWAAYTDNKTKHLRL